MGFVCVCVSLLTYSYVCISTNSHVSHVNRGSHEVLQEVALTYAAFFRCGTESHRMSCESLYRGMSYLEKQNPMATPTKVKAVCWGFRNNVCVCGFPLHNID